MILPTTQTECCLTLLDQKSCVGMVVFGGGLSWSTNLIPSF